nr:probable methyltransferase PMT23 [Tanacetum cinerariifolium]
MIIRIPLNENSPGMVGVAVAFASQRCTPLDGYIFPIPETTKWTTPCLQRLKTKPLSLSTVPYVELIFDDDTRRWSELVTNVYIGGFSRCGKMSGWLPILNPNEFDLYKIRIEQYFLLTDYSLWEVILNGDSPAPTRVVNDVLQSVTPTTAEQRLARKNKLKACGTLLMALPNKLQLKFNTHKDAKTLMEAIKKRSIPSDWRTHTLIWRNKTNLEEQSLDDLFNSLKIYKAEVKSSSSASTTTQNIAFVFSSNTDNTNEPVSAAASVSAISAKIPVFSALNIDADDLEEMDLR